MRCQLAALAIVGALGACRTALVDEHNDAQAMRAAILRMTPLGSATSDAASRLRVEGFTCGSVVEGSFDGDSLQYVGCQASSSARGLVVRRWHVALVDSSAVLTGVRVSTGLVGP